MPSHTPLRTLPGLCLIAALTHAATPDKPWQPDDFAWGIELRPGGHSGLLAVELPESFYTGLASADAADFRVFNAAGQPLVHRLERERARAAEPQRHSVPIFPLYADDETLPDNLSVRFERNADGTLLDIRDTAVDRTPEKTPAGYIVDNSANAGEADNRVLTELAVEPAGAAPFTRSVAVERSDDLTHWSVVTGKTVLAKLEFEGQHLEKTAIELPDVRAKYLRITGAGGEAIPPIKRVTVELIDRTQQTPLRWSQPVPLKPAPPDNETADNAFVFDTGGFFPVSRIELHPGGANFVYRGKLESRAEPTGDWRYRAGLNRYRIQTGEGLINSEPVRLGPVRDPHWRIRFDYPPAVKQPPSARFAWQPERLVFVAQGEPPYTLAFGNPNVGPPANPGREVIELFNRNNVEPASVEHSPRHELGGPEKLQPPKAPFPWKTVLLWAVLVTGVIVMVAMAVRLYRQMGSDNH